MRTRPPRAPSRCASDEQSMHTTQHAHLPTRRVPCASAHPLASGDNHTQSGDNTQSALAVTIIRQSLHRMERVLARKRTLRNIAKREKREERLEKFMFPNLTGEFDEESPYARHFSGRRDNEDLQHSRMAGVGLGVGD